MLRMSNDAAKARLRLFLIKRDGARCINCGETKDLHIDHCVPMAAGGSDNPYNLQILCRACNLSKGVKIFNARFSHLCRVEPQLLALERECEAFIPVQGLISYDRFFHQVVKAKMQRLVGYGRSFPAMEEWRRQHPDPESVSGEILTFVPIEIEGMPECPSSFIFTSEAYDICYHHLNEILGGDS